MKNSANMYKTNQLKFKTSQNQPIILEESMEYTSIY